MINRACGSWWKVALLSVVLACGSACGNNASNNGPGQTTPTCSSTCTPSQRKCQDDKTVLSCIEQENGCFDFGSPSSCPGIKTCSAGQCVDMSSECPNPCQPGSPPRCNTQGQSEECLGPNAQGCWSYGQALDCGDGFACNPDNGQCEASTCQDECVENETRCEGELISRCERSKSGCLIYAPARDCKSGSVCSGGACMTSTSCEDECVAGERVCGPGNIPRLCEDGNDDACVEYVDQPACTGGQVCRAGECVDGGGCTDECAPGERACVGARIAECGNFDGDSCREFGPDAACPNAGDTCQATASGPACQPPPMSGQVVINEVFYDTLEASDVQSDGSSSTFVELYGTPGLSLANYQIRLTSGADGSVYGTATLPADAALDGNGYALLIMPLTDIPFFLLLATNVYDVLPAIASGQDALGNGPDSLELLNASGTRADSVGYTRYAGPGFSNMAHFRGEGSPALGVDSGRSLGRKGAGQDTQDNSADFISFFPTPGFANADLVINEVYVNQPGADGQAGTMETFIELVAPFQGWVDLKLEGYVLRAVNGADGRDYLFTDAADGVVFSSFDRLDAIPGAPGFVVVCNLDASDAILDLCSVPYIGVDYQNGPDNFVLEYQGRTIDAVGYGSFSATQTFAGEGTPVSEASAGQSLGRAPKTDPSRQIDTNDNAADFRAGSPTPAADNDWP